MYYGCVCVTDTERERERERDRHGQTDRQTDTHTHTHTHTCTHTHTMYTHISVTYTLKLHSVDYIQRKILTFFKTKQTSNNKSKNITINISQIPKTPTDYTTTQNITSSLSISIRQAEQLTYCGNVSVLPTEHEEIHSNLLGRTVQRQLLVEVRGRPQAGGILKQRKLHNICCSTHFRPADFKYAFFFLFQFILLWTWQQLDRGTEM